MWDNFWAILDQFLPVIVLCVIISQLVYVIFVVLLGSRDRKAAAAAGLPPTDDYGALLGPSYALMSALFGSAFGILVSLMGGFRAAATASAEGSLIAAVIAAVGLGIAVAGSLFLESGQISLRRPVGAITLLICFVISGLYWQSLLS